MECRTRINCRYFSYNLRIAFLYGILRVRMLYNFCAKSGISRSFLLFKAKSEEEIMQAIVNQIEEMVTPVISQMNLELVDIEYVREGKDYFLRLYVDVPGGGIDIEQCARVSEKVSEILDEKDPIKENYFLEVSSPGAERPLKKEQDFVQAVGSYVFVKTYEPIDGRKEFEGTLQSYSKEDGLKIDYRIKTRKLTVEIPKDKVALARLAIDFSA